VWLLTVGGYVAGRPHTMRAAQWGRLQAPAYLVLVVLVLGASAGLALARGFNGLYGQDAYAYFDYAVGPLRGALLTLAPWPPFFWPPGYPLLVALASFVVGPAPVAGQAVSLLMGAAVPLLTALLVAELRLGGRRLPVLAGVLVALGGQLWQSSIVVMADTTGLAMATLAAWAVVRYSQRQALPWLLLASGAVVLALLSRWIYGLVAVPLALYVLVSRPRLWHIAAAGALGLLLLAPVLGPPLLGLISTPEAPASFAGNLQVYTWSPLNAFQRDFVTPDGNLRYSRPNGLYYALAPANTALFGPLLAPWILVGLLVGLRAWSKSALLLVVGWAAVVYAFHAGAPWQNFRFTLAYVPPLAILIATGLVWAADRLGARPIALWLALGLMVVVVGGVRLVNGFVDRQQEDLALVSWVEAQVAPDARLLTFGPTLTFTHVSQLPTQDLFDLPDAEIERTTPTYLLVDIPNLEEQWADQRPATIYHRLRDGPGLHPLGTRGTFSLFRVGAP
jgi:hypothetical protein